MEGGLERPQFAGMTEFFFRRGPYASPVESYLLNLLWDEGRSDDPLAHFFAEGLLMSLAAALARAAASPSGAQVGAVVRRGGLPPFRLRRVTDLIGDRLADDLDLDKLAEAAGLSTFHFARVFKAETGTSPHRWLLEWSAGRSRSRVRRSRSPRLRSPAALQARTALRPPSSA